MKLKRLLFIIIMSIISLVIYKQIVMLKYTYNVDLVDITNKFNTKNKISIENRKVSKYITYSSLKIEDVFNEYTKVEDDKLRYIDYEEDTIKAYISISKEASYLSIYINGFKDIKGNNIKDENISKIVAENKIDNDIELFNYLKNNYDNTNLFSSNDRIKENYYNKIFMNNILPPIEKYTIIEGDYYGYIIMSSEKLTNVYLCYGLNNYVITFGGKYYEDDIYRLIGTIVIDEEK